MARTPWDLDDLVEQWTLLKDEQALVSGKRGATRLGFAVLLKFYTQYGRFPRGRFELSGAAVEFVAGQVQVPASELDAYERSGVIEYHRAQIRGHLGFRERSVADADKRTAWLAEHGACKERRPEQLRVELLARCRAESIEPPTAGRVRPDRGRRAASCRGDADGEDLGAAHGGEQGADRGPDRQRRPGGRRRTRRIYSGRTGKEGRA
ncbi:DUF4158 domain-containing protein [Streptomyces sp. NPDC056470]|uniref:DUF4158 domain-containing protein n=1 Tax=Streptomyces sp. NPDC056470 TaxID=3345831 RepID=UPI003696B6E5